MREDRNGREVSALAEAILIVLTWERNRPQAVTLDEICERLDVPRGKAKAALGELYDAGYVSAGPTSARLMSRKKAIGEREAGDDAL